MLGYGKPKGAPNRALIFKDESDDDISLEHESSSEDEEDDLVLRTDEEVSVGEIILCQFDVGNLLSIMLGLFQIDVDEEGDLEVNFFQKE